MADASMEIGAKRFPIWMARITGGGACGIALVMLLLAFLSRHDFLFCGVAVILGLWAAVFGGWLLAHAARLARLRVVLGPSSVRIVAPLWFARRLTATEIPWSCVDRFDDVQIPNSSWPRGAQTFCILYTRQGQFTLDGGQWQNLSALRREIALRTGCVPGDSSSARSAAQSSVQLTQRRAHHLQRMLGKLVAAVSAPLFLMAVVGGVVNGYSADLCRGMIFLFFAFSLGVAMARFYRRDAGLPLRNSSRQREA
jgi:hypothetical protein